MRRRRPLLLPLHRRGGCHSAVRPAAPAAAHLRRPDTATDRDCDRAFILQALLRLSGILGPGANLFASRPETAIQTEEGARATDAGQLQQHLPSWRRNVRDQKEKDFHHQAASVSVARRAASMRKSRPASTGGAPVDVALEPLLKSLMTERGAEHGIDIRRSFVDGRCRCDSGCGCRGGSTRPAARQVELTGGRAGRRRRCRGAPAPQSALRAAPGAGRAAPPEV